MKWPTNTGNRKVQLGVALLIGLFVLGLAVSKCAAASEASYSQVGLGSTFIRGETSVIDLAFVYPEAAPADANLEVGATFIGPSELKGADQRNNFAVRATVVEKLWRFDVGLGIAYLQNVDTYNGSHLNFNLLLGYNFRRLPITLRVQHFSNGGTQSPNKGRDMLLVLWRFQ